MERDQATGEFAQPLGLKAVHGPHEPSLVGRTLGKYHIKRVIASGGMGNVYEAVQESPRRTVALKVMKYGVASRSALRRFEYEAQILARLRHPGIAQVYEAGVHEEGREGSRQKGIEASSVRAAEIGRQLDAAMPRSLDAFAVPYFAMEYVPNAKPITEYARAKQLSTRERLELFAKVCDAVYHGHQKGIIHRDLKPSNILVDSSGQPKVIDFGVARATDSDLAVTTLQTDVGQLIGTLQYMSPEQCDADPHDLDTRSDVYALGVVLYELLCQQLPYDVSRHAVYEAARVIREVNPPRPSSLNKTLRGDVETIALKALEKERQRRYRSAAELGEDISRYLNNEPINARPPSVMYQVRTFARRNKAVVAGGAATFAALLVGIVVATALYLRAEEARLGESRQRQLAQDREQEATAALRAAEESERQTALAMEQLFAAEMDARQRADELERVAAFQANQLSNIDVATMAIRLRSDLIQRRRAHLERQGVDEQVIEAALLELDQSLTGINFTNVALEALDEFILQRASDAIEDDFSDQPLVKARLLQSLGNTMSDLGLPDRAMTLLEESMNIRRGHFGDERPETLASGHDVGVILRILGRYERSLELQIEVLDARRRLLGDEHLDTAASHNELGELLRQMGRHDESRIHFSEAIEIRKRILGPEHDETLTSIHNLGGTLFEQGDLDGAEPLFRTALDGFRRNHGELHPLTLTAENSMILLISHRGSTEEVEQRQRDILDRVRAAFGDLHPHTLTCMNNLAVTLIYARQHDEAAPLMRHVHDVRRRVLGDDHPTTRNAAHDLAHALYGLGVRHVVDERHSEAASLVREALELARYALGDDDVGVRVLASGLGYVLTLYGRSLTADGRFDDAHVALLEAVALLDSPASSESQRADARQSLAELYERWHAVDPSAGHDNSAAEWRARLPEATDDPHHDGSADAEDEE